MESTLTTKDRHELREFLLDAIPRYRNNHSRRDLSGVASGNLFGILDVINRALRRKLKDRQGLVSAARDLGFVIDIGIGGSSRGAVVWEYIDLPPKDRR